MLASPANQHPHESKTSRSSVPHFTFVALLTGLGLLASAQIANASTSVALPPGSCSPLQVRGLFSKGVPARKQLRVAVAQFASNDESLSQEGKDVAARLRADLDKQVRESLDLKNSGLRTADVHVQVLPCSLTSHEHALRIGRAAGALVVFWGQLYGNKSHGVSGHPVQITVQTNNNPITVVNSSGISSTS